MQAGPIVALKSAQKTSAGAGLAPPPRSRFTLALTGREPGFSVRRGSPHPSGVGPPTFGRGPRPRRPLDRETLGWVWFGAGVPNLRSWAPTPPSAVMETFGRAKWQGQETLPQWRSRDLATTSSSPDPLPDMNLGRWGRSPLVPSCPDFRIQPLNTSRSC